MFEWLLLILEFSEDIYVCCRGAALIGFIKLITV